MPLKNNHIAVKWIDAKGVITIVELPIGEDLAILDLCDIQNLELPHGCRSGSCGTCRVKVTSGAELLKQRSFLEHDTLDYYKDSEDIRLACRAKINADAATCQTKELILCPAPATMLAGE